MSEPETTQAPQPTTLETAAAGHERPYAILRIKRKRHEEPLDGLVVNQDVARPKGKRSRSGLNFFKFAETVEQGAWDDEQAKWDLENRLAALARESREDGDRNSAQQEGLPTSKSAPAEMGQATPPTPSTDPPPAKRARPDETPRKYTILRRDGPSTDPNIRRRMPVAPPKVWSLKELEAARAAKARLALYDAVPSAGATESSSMDSEIAKFLPLLQDYLKLQDPEALPTEARPAPTEKEDEGDYVYDIFYQRLTRDPSATLGNVATLTDVPDELILGESDNDSDSEVYDTADEDSNAEDWYQNDYPDEESGSEGSDMFHENSDHEDMMYDDDEDHEWR